MPVVGSMPSTARQFGPVLDVTTVVTIAYFPEASTATDACGPAVGENGGMGLTAPVCGSMDQAYIGPPNPVNTERFVT